MVDLSADSITITHLAAALFATSAQDVIDKNCGFISLGNIFSKQTSPNKPGYLFENLVL
jgi:hypothetical protein